jgi:RecA/RadA recombinase
MHMAFAIPPGNDVLSRFVGSYESGRIYTLYGPAASGKTTCCFLAAIGCSLSGNKAIFLDAECGFSPERVMQLSPGGNKAVLDNILLLKVASFADQESKIELLYSLTKENRVKLIVIDTVTYHYRTLVTRMPEEINRRMLEQLRKLSLLAKSTECIILLTSQVYSIANQERKISPAGGELIRNHSDFLVELDKDDLGARKATLIKPKKDGQGASCMYEIREKGLFPI